MISDKGVCQHRYSTHRLPRKQWLKYLCVLECGDGELWTCNGRDWTKYRVVVAILTPNMTNMTQQIVSGTPYIYKGFDHVLNLT